MKNILSYRIILTLHILFLLTGGFSCFAQKNPVSEPPAATIKMQYHYPSDKAVKYRTYTRVVQDMDINEQSMMINSSTIMRCSVKFADKDGENLKLEIKIDTMAHILETPQSATGGEVTEAKYKVFFLTIASTGKVTDRTEAAKIVFNIPGSGTSDAAQSFLGFFPVIPVNEVKPGDTWSVRDTVNTKTSTTTTWIPAESNYKFEATEKYMGFDCVKIIASVTGNMKMTNLSQGMEVTTSGAYTGTKTLLFAVKEGYFVKESTYTRMTGTIEFTNQGMSFPVVMDITSTNEILK